MIFKRPQTFITYRDEPEARNSTHAEICTDQPACALGDVPSSY